METDTQNGWPPAAPPPFRQTSPQLLELREGGKVLAMFGLPFFLAGCFISFNFLRAVLLGAPSHAGLARLGFDVIGIAFTCIGAVLIFGRRWLVIDLSHELLIKSYGLLVPLRTRERPLTEFNAVILAHDPGDADTAENFPVRLRSTTGPDFKVRAPGRFGESRALAHTSSASYCRSSYFSSFFLVRFASSRAPECRRWATSLWRCCLRCYSFRRS